MDANPLDVRLPRRRTKRQRREQRSKRVTFRPLEAVELRRLADVLADAQKGAERLDFPLTQFLLLTGLRYGEAAGWAGLTSRCAAPGCASSIGLRLQHPRVRATSTRKGPTRNPASGLVELARPA